MAITSTTQQRELSMQISRLLDQTVASGDPFTTITAALRQTLIAVDAQIKAIEQPGPHA